MTDCKTISELLGASRNLPELLRALLHVLSPVLIYFATDVLTMDNAFKSGVFENARRRLRSTKQILLAIDKIA